MNRILFYLQGYVKKIWFRCLLSCIIAMSAFFVGPYFEIFMPAGLDKIVSQEGLAEILKILASSMLAVSIFSLSIIVQAFSSATSNASPRANRLLMENASSNNALGTFIGSFLFSVVGLIGLSSNYYSEKVVTLLFFLTLAMILIIVVVFLGWIDQVSKLGRVNVTIQMVENALINAINIRVESTSLNSRSTEELNPSQTSIQYPIPIDKIGYIQYIDIEALNETAESNDINIIIQVNAGTFVDSVNPFVFSNTELSEDLHKTIANAFIVGQDRTFSQDPRFGFVVLSEIALKALSPAVNDPGTAVDILGSHVRALKHWHDAIKNKHAEQSVKVTDSRKTSKVNEKQHANADNPMYSRIYSKPIDGSDVLEDIFGQMIIDAASSRIVAVRLRKALHTIEQFNDEDFAPHVHEWYVLLQERCQKYFQPAELAKIFK